jgi:LPXTG-site transpeptidase (sortase) family protein
MRGVATVIVVVLIAAAGATFVLPSPAAALENRYHVEETGHVLADPFLTHWAQANGKQTLGLPVTDVVELRDRDAQYFEFGVLRARSTSARDPKIEPMAAGADLLAARHEPMRLVAGRRVGGERTASSFVARAEPTNDRIAYDESTGHTISGRILRVYKELGGMDQFGQPLSDSYVTRGMRVQWFEYGRLQWRLDDERVELGPVGLELAIARGEPTGRAERGDLATFDPSRFRGYRGDGTIPQAPGPFEPVALRIPAIEIDAAIEEVAIVGGAMGVPQDAWNVGWYPTISMPGEFTNVVLAGHRDWWNIGPVVFYNLERLNPGDKIYLLGDDGSGFTYRVVDRWLIDNDTHAGEIVSDTGAEMLTLITCGGAFNGVEYENRVIVRAERI